MEGNGAAFNVISSFKPALFAVSIESASISHAGDLSVLSLRTICSLTATSRIFNFRSKVNSCAGFARLSSVALVTFVPPCSISTSAHSDINFTFTLLKSVKLKGIVAIALPPVISTGITCPSTSIALQSFGSNFFHSLSSVREVTIVALDSSPYEVSLPSPSV